MNKLSSKIILVILLFLSIGDINAQTTSNPVTVTVSNSGTPVSAGEKNYVTVQLEVPKFIWLGAEKEEARTPPGTHITVPVMNGFIFDAPQYPESIKEWVPAKLGTTQVFKEKVTIIVPFTVDASVAEGNYDLPFEVTYTPGYNAGRLATHHAEVFSTNVTVAKNAGTVSIPAPSLGSVSDDFYVKPKSFDDIPDMMMFMFTPLNESNGLIKGLHKVWLDKPGHGKTVRIMPFPIFSTSKIVGTSLGMGASFANATKEGTMTGMFSMAGYYNDLIGAGGSIQAISCPGAYHNYQFSAAFGGEGFRDVTLHYENLTMKNSTLGVDVNLASTNEPRMRFYGLGPLSVEENESVYEQTNLGAIVDLYALPKQNFRFGVGVGYSDRSTDISFDEVKETEEIPFLQEDTLLVAGLLGLDGAKQLSLRANLIYDHRDQEFAPSRGFYAKMTGSYNSLSDVTDDIEDSYLGLDVDMRQYFSGPSQKLVVLMRGQLSLKSESDIPFYLLSSLGGLTSSRAYDRERFLGQHSGFVSAEMRYTMFTMQVLGYPMSVEMGAFLDVGQVFGDDVSFGDELNVDPGISLRMINKPNVGAILNYAFGEDGGYLTGGIGLPF